MRFEILGPLRAFDGDAEIDLGGPRQQRVLAVLLAAAPDMVSVDRLIDEVWGESPPGTASHVVRTYVSNLRKTLGDRVVSDGQRYRITLNSDSVDALEFSGAFEEARTLFPADPVRVVGLLRDSSLLWRGRPFDHLSDDAPLLALRAIELDEERTQSTELLMEAELALGNHERVLPELESLAVEYPLRERLHRALMLALYRSDRQAEALRAGWSLRNALVEELGIEPSASTRKLEDRILVQDPMLDVRPPTNLPAFVSSFVGRRRELAEVSKLLDVDRLVTLVGVGGVGKTRLARQVAHELLDRYPDGVWWVDLAVLTSGGDAAARTTEVLGLVGQPGVDSVALLSRYLARRRTLLVLDNCEHVVEDVARLASDVLQAADDLTVLVTSRRPLQAAGEVRYVVPSMSLPMGVLGVSDAERLFVERATRVDREFTVTESLEGDIAEICRLMEGLPLAIEMAAVHVNAVSPADIARRSAVSLELPNRDTTAPDRHRSLAATIDWSYDLLTPEQQVLFDRLSVFVGSFDLPAASAVAGWGPLHPTDVTFDLETLVDASMVTVERTRDGRPRYRLLDTLRAYGRDRLVKRSESDAMALRHSRSYLEMARTSADVWLTPRHPATVGPMAAAHDDLVCALEWSLDHEPRTATLAAAPGLCAYWFWRGDPANAHRFGVRMLEGAEDAPLSMQAAAHLSVAFGAQLIGDLAASASSSATAIEMLEQTEAWKLLLWAYNGQGQGGVFFGMPDLTEGMGRQILELCDVHNARLPRGYGLALLGEAEFFGDGDFDAARALTEEAIPLLRELGDEAALNMFALGILAAVAALQLDFETAERAATEASTLGGPGWSATALIVLGTFVLSPRGDVDRAEMVVKEGLKRVYERSMEPWVRTGLFSLGRIAAGRGQWEAAARLLGGCRPHLPPWAQHPRWWNVEPAVRAALGEDRYQEIAARAENEPLDDLVSWALESVQ